MSVICKIIVLCGFVTACSVVYVAGGGGSIVADGMWSVIHIEQCKDASQYTKMKVEVEKNKYNRTIDVFYVKMESDETMDSTYGMRIEVCKHVDGGCKPYQTIVDDSLERFITKYAKGNLDRALSMTQPPLDKPEFPIPAGSYEIKDFFLDSCDLPLKGPPDVFEAEVYVVKYGIDVACIKAKAEFVENSEPCNKE